MVDAVASLAIILIVLAYIISAIQIYRHCKQMDEEDEAFWAELSPDEADANADPCDTCHRWYECKGVDKDNCPKWSKEESK